MYVVRVRQDEDMWTRGLLNTECQEHNCLVVANVAPVMGLASYCETGMTVIAKLGPET